MPTLVQDLYQGPRQYSLTTLQTGCHKASALPHQCTLLLPAENSGHPEGHLVIVSLQVLLLMPGGGYAGTVLMFICTHKLLQAQPLLHQNLTPKTFIHPKKAEATCACCPVHSRSSPVKWPNRPIQPNRPMQRCVKPSLQAGVSTRNPDCYACLHGESPSPYFTQALLCFLSFSPFHPSPALLPILFPISPKPCSASYPFPHFTQALLCFLSFSLLHPSPALLPSLLIHPGLLQNHPRAPLACSYHC